MISSSITPPGVNCRRGVAQACRRPLAQALAYILSASWLLAAAGAQERAVSRCKVVASGADPAMVSIDIGRQSGVALDDVFWVMASPRLMCGRVNFVTDDSAAGRLGATPGSEVAGAEAAVLYQARLPALREPLPPEVAIHGRVTRLVPGRQTAWINIGRSAGLRGGDSMLVLRSGIPVARGEIAVLDKDAAVIGLQPLVGNAVVELGDRVELWPAPGLHPGRINSTILQVAPDKEGDLITIVGSAEDGLTEGRLVELYRGEDEYVGVASLLAVSRHPLSQAKVINAASRDQPREGDRAVIRAPREPAAPALRCVIFRIQEDYCLVAGGEVDGLQRDEKLWVLRDSKRIAELTIDKVNVDYSGAFIRPLDSAGAAVQQWDWAERREPAWPHWESIGRAEAGDAASRTVKVALVENSEVGEGDVVGLFQKEAIGGGVLIARSGTAGIIYIAPGWGDAQALSGADVRVAMRRLPTSEAADASTSAPAE